MFKRKNRKLGKIGEKIEKSNYGHVNERSSCLLLKQGQKPDKN